MNSMIRQFASIVVVCVACVSMSGCLISGLSAITGGGTTTATATVTLQNPANCVVDTVAQTSTCTAVITVNLPGGGTQSFPFSITIKGYTGTFPLYDPLIVQVPASMSNFAGSIAVGPPGITPGTPLQITAGLTSVPIDATTDLVAEAGTQLVIIDFQAPQNAPFGQYTLTFQFSGTATSIKLLFAGKVGVGVAEEKAGPPYYLPIYPCVTSFANVPAIPIPLVSLTQLLPIIATTQGCVGKIYDLTGGLAATVNVVEYYNANLDHYFITWLPAEQANLDAGNTPTRWNRTGKTFKAYTTAQASTSDICRYYIPPGKGDSHFFGRGTVECNATGANNPTFILEDPKFMYMFLPTLGVCPAGTTNVHRVFSNRLDANHRYMTEPAVRDQMVATGWLAEGDGPNLVVMCAPN